MATTIEYALMAANAYREARSMLENVLPIPSGWTLMDGMDINDPNTGFMARVYFRGDEIVNAYTGKAVPCG